MCVLGWISRSHARDGNEIQTPGHYWLPKKRWDTWFLNSSKSKTRLKFMKHGMLSWSGINMSWWIFFPFGAGLDISFSRTRAYHNKHDGFDRERTTFGDGTISVASYCFQKISSDIIEQQECCVQSWNFSGFVWPFYTLTGFSRHFMCIIQIWTTSTCSDAPKLVEKSHVCPWVNF